MLSQLVLVSAVLLVYSTVVWANEENDLIVLTTVSRLREEIRREMSDAELCTCQPQNCSSLNDEIVAEIKTSVTDSVKAAVSRTVEDLIRSTFSHLLIPGYTRCYPSSSCKEILQLAPQSPSGLYWIRGTDNVPKNMYCDMERSCKGVAGGWMRVASINMTNTRDNCPSGLGTLTSPLRLCAMNNNGAGCSSTVFQVQGIEYSQVCGKIIGYQQKTPDAFYPFIGGGQNTIDTYYVDGISITHGQSPRKHIWTLVAALHEYNSRKSNVCPCTNTRNTPPPAVPGFIGNDYFCDTGSENHFQYIFYGADPLWDGAGCGEYNTCCDWNSPPWFRKTISPPTTDDIEMRLCADEERVNEDITFETLEIYVQ